MAKIKLTLSSLKKTPKVKNIDGNLRTYSRSGLSDSPKHGYREGDTARPSVSIPTGVKRVGYGGKSAYRPPSKKTEGRFEGAGRSAGAAVDRGVASVGAGVNRAGYAAKRGVASVKNAVRATGRSVINAGNEVANKAKMAGAYAKKKERSAAYQVGKLITGQTKNQNANRRAGRIGYAGIAATGTAIGSVGAHIANRSREGNPSKPSMGNETSQNYNSSSWSAHKKTQRGY